MKLYRTVKRQNRPIYRSTYKLPKRATRYPRVGVLIVTSIMVLIGSVYIIFLSGFFKIHQIIVEGSGEVPSSDIVQLVRQTMQSSFLGDNSLFVNTGGLEKKLLNQNYQLENVHISRQLPNDLKVAVTFRTPALLWRSNDSIYVLAANGNAIAQPKTTNFNLPTVVDTTNLPVKLGDQVVPSSFINFTQSLVGKLSTAKLEVKELSVPETTTELYIQTKQGYIIKFDTTKRVEDQFSELQLVLQTLKAQNKTPQQYIDLRIENRAFYK